MPDTPVTPWVTGVVFGHDRRSHPWVYGRVDLAPAPEGRRGGKKRPGPEGHTRHGRKHWSCSKDMTEAGVIAHRCLPGRPSGPDGPSGTYPSDTPFNPLDAGYDRYFGYTRDHLGARPGDII